MQKIKRSSFIKTHSDENLSYIEWKEWSAETFGTFTPEEHAQFSCEMRLARIELTQCSNVLEIGFGNGVFAAWVRRRTQNYVGSESNLQLVERARRAGLEAHAATLNLESIASGRSFDLIAAFDVLEHLELEEIIQLLKSSGRCLSAHGRLVIRVPSGDSPFSGRFMYGDITHTTCLGSMAFYQLAALSGLKVVDIRDSAFPILGFGPAAATLRVLIVLARKLISKIIRIIFYGNKFAAISPNLTAVLRADPNNHSQI